MVFIRQSRPSQEARWTLPPRGLGPHTDKPVAAFPAQGKAAYPLPWEIGFSCERRCCFGFQAFDLRLESLAFPHPQADWKWVWGSSGKSPGRVIHLFALRKPSWKCIPAVASAQPSLQREAGCRPWVEDSCLNGRSMFQTPLTYCVASAGWSPIWFNLLRSTQNYIP